MATTDMLCLPERQEGTCQGWTQTFTFTAPAGTSRATVYADAFTDNEAQREECARVTANGASRMTCTIAQPIGPSEVVFSVPAQAGPVVVKVEHLSAREFPIVAECPWDDAKPWLFQPDGSPIHTCTPGSMHVSVDVRFAQDVPVPTTTLPPTTTVPAPTTTVATSPSTTSTTVPGVGIVTSTDEPPMLPETGMPFDPMVASSFALTLVVAGALLLKARRRHV